MDAGGIERVVDLRAVAARLHETRLAEHLQVLADRGLADPEDLGEVARTGAAFRGQPEGDAEPHRVTESLQLR